mmetsp:Transcript_7724/g.21335  ORF Transcript_7724/g.21335 Transcript_7724/m.21335 type:complete len:96 (-) Transcript_7724:116-403(-)
MGWHSALQGEPRGGPPVVAVSLLGVQHMRGGHHRQKSPCGLPAVLAAGEVDGRRACVGGNKLACRRTAEKAEAASFMRHRRVHDAAVRHLLVARR